MNLGYVYTHKRKTDGKIFYVGIGGFAKSEPPLSFKRAYKMTQRNMHHAAIVAKHGVNVEIIATQLSLEKAKELEIELIAHYDLFKQGANQTLGGDGTEGFSHKLASKLKVSRATKARFDDLNWRMTWLETMRCRPPITRHKEVDFKGPKNPFFGKSHSASTKEKLAELGKIQCKGHGNPRFKGRCFTPNGVFDDARAASEALGIAYSTVCSRCRKTQKQWEDWFFEKDR